MVLIRCFFGVVCGIFLFLSIIGPKTTPGCLVLATRNQVSGKVLHFPKDRLVSAERHLRQHLYGGEGDPNGTDNAHVGFRGHGGPERTSKTFWTAFW